MLLKASADSTPFIFGIATSIRIISGRNSVALFMAQTLQRGFHTNPWL